MRKFPKRKDETEIIIETLVLLFIITFLIIVIHLGHLL